jgi:hypothetical protein
MNVFHYQQYIYDGQEVHKNSLKKLIFFLSIMLCVHSLVFFVHR